MSDDPLSQKAHDWDASEDAIFEASDGGYAFSLPVLALRDLGTELLPGVPGRIRHKRASFAWKGRAVPSSDPRDEYARAGFTAATQVAELLSVQLAGQVEASVALAGAMTSLVEGVGAATAQLLTTAGEVAAVRSQVSGDDGKLALASQALESITSLWGASMQAGSEDGPEWKRLARIARELGQDGLALDLEGYTPVDLAAWVREHIGTVMAAISAAGKDRLQALSTADKLWLDALKKRVQQSK